MFADVKITVAARLIDGHGVEPETARSLADKYVIAVLKPADSRSGRSACCMDIPDFMYVCRDGAGVALFPDLDAGSTGESIARLTSCLPSDGWVAIAQRPIGEIAEGYREAMTIAQLLAAGRRRSGVYRITDVLVEYAAIRERTVRDRLVALIKPLRDHPVLWDSLLALVDADHNRNQAARLLFVHRSTFDYRMRRVADITGVDLASTHGVNRLAIALVAHSVQYQ